MLTNKFDKQQKYVWIYKPVEKTDLNDHIIIKLIQWRNGSGYACKRFGWKIYSLDK
jgi:hypothetical protein